MIRVVIDTSVLVSAVISPDGPNAQLFDRIVAREIRPYVTDVLLEEYTGVFGYDRLKHLDKKRILRLRQILEQAAIKVKPRGNLKISSHADDNRI